MWYLSNIFWFTFSNLCRQVFCNFRKKKKYQNGPYINTLQTNLRNVWLLVVLEFCLCPRSVYISLYRGLEYSPKIRYIIEIDPLWDGFLIFETVFWAGRQHCPMSEKQKHINECHLHLIPQKYLKWNKISSFLTISH